MIHTTIIPSTRRDHVNFASPIMIACAALIAACSGDRVNVGEDTPEPVVPGNSRCAQATAIAESVTVRNQAELDELQGCETIEGDLNIVPFAEADLRPLRALTVVKGALNFRGAPDTVLGADFIRIDALNAAGWLTSFEGLESLESVGALAISGVSSTNLAPLAHLRVITSGSLLITSCTNLRDLSGLENVAPIRDLSLTCASLESLAGLQLSPDMASLWIDAQNLVDLGSFGVKNVGSDLTIMNTALRNLDAFADLAYVDGIIAFWQNSVLEDMAGLDQLVVAESLVIRQNENLERLPAFESMSRLHGLMVYDNARLRELSTFPSLFDDSELLAEFMDENQFARNMLDRRPDYIEVVGNPELEQFNVPRGWQSGSHVAIRNNARLRSVDFARLGSVDRLVIENNPLLDSVALGELGRVDSLVVQSNPLLPVSDFDSVQTFERKLSGNAPAEAP